MVLRYWALTRMSSYDGHTVIGTRLIVWSAIRGPMPMSALLDPVEERLALLDVALARLLLEHVVDVGIPAVGVGALGADELRDPAGRVARVADRGHEHAAQLLFPPCGVEGGALHRPHLHPDADRVEVVQRRLRHRGEPGNRHELAGVEPVRIPGLGEELLGLRRIVGRRLDLQREVHDARHDDPGRRAKAQTGGLVRRLAVEGQVHCLPQALVVPGRLRVPLLGELEPEDGRVA